MKQKHESDVCEESKPYLKDDGKVDIGSVVNALSERSRRRGLVRMQSCKPLPSRQAIIDIVEMIRVVVFPQCYGPEDLDQDSLPYHVGATVDKVHHAIREQLHRGLCFDCDGSQLACDNCLADADAMADHFVACLPHVTRMLGRDVRATYIGDPAAISEDEVVFSYPGISATFCYRIAHELYRLGSPIIARIITEYAHSITGVDIHPGATIAEGFMIDHGTGVVIGETCVIGKNVRVYQGVTLGAKSFPLDEHGNPIKGIKRHPNIGDRVVIYSGATILGDVDIGADCVIGGNVWLTDSVPSGTRVLQSRVVREYFGDGEGI